MKKLDLTTDRAKTQLALANEKIRELEAELARMRNYSVGALEQDSKKAGDCPLGWKDVGNLPEHNSHDNALRDAVARAEKAEMLAHRVVNERDLYKARLEREQARAEKADAELATLRSDNMHAHGVRCVGLLARAEKAEDECERHLKTLIITEARVAELRNEIWTCHAVNEGRTHPLAEREGSR